MFQMHFFSMRVLHLGLALAWTGAATWSLADFRPDINSYKTGLLVGQDGWKDGSSPVDIPDAVVNAFVTEEPDQVLGAKGKALYFQLLENRTASVEAYRQFPPTSGEPVRLTCWVLPSVTTRAAKIQLYERNFSSGHVLTVGLMSNGRFFWLQTNEYVFTQGHCFDKEYRADTWYGLQADLFPETGTFNFCVTTNPAAPAVYFQTNSLPLALPFRKIDYVRPAYHSHLGAPSGENGVVFDRLSIQSIPASDTKKK